MKDFGFDDLLVTVTGKGDQQRRMPFSVDLRRFSVDTSRTAFASVFPQREPLMFPSHSGVAWDQQNALGSLYLFEDRSEVKRFGFHRLRFAAAVMSSDSREHSGRM